tara:strand:+ start:119145 stop:120422 length:1278 start_codon:yes stop_codon:yes gene_type:complete
MTVDDFLQQYHSAELPGIDQAWLQDLRAQGLNGLEEHGFPAVKEENWKYTRVTPILKPEYHLAKLVEVNQTQIQQHIVTDGSVLVFINGHYSDSHSQLKAGDNVLVDSLANAIDTHYEVVSRHLGQVANIETSGFASLNTAMMQDGAFIHIAKDAVVKRPIQLIFISTGAEHMINHTRNLILADTHSQADIFTTYVSLDDSLYFNTIVNEIVLGDNAQLKLYKSQLESPNAFHVNYTFTQQARDSQFYHYNMDCGSQLTRNWLETQLQQPGAYCSFNGLYLIKDKQHIDNHTRIDHQAANTNSHEFYKGILNDKGRGVFNGQVMIRPDAQLVNAEQQNRNLLLSTGAEIDTKPELEIYADDVKCSHGATIGQLDEASIFYLQSRGISRDEAKAILTHGFGYEVLENFEHEGFREQCTKHLESWLD